jgi:hypothetical protein
VLPVLRYTDSDYLFVIFKLFFQYQSQFVPQMLTELYPYSTDINPLISLGGIVSINELTLILEEEFEDNKEVIRIRISKGGSMQWIYRKWRHRKWRHPEVTWAEEALTGSDRVSAFPRFFRTRVVVQMCHCAWPTGLPEVTLTLRLFSTPTVRTW